MGDFNFLIEGRGLGPALAEVERSERASVLGPNIGKGKPGTPSEIERMIVRVQAESVDEGQRFLWSMFRSTGLYAVAIGLQAPL